MTQPGQVPVFITTSLEKIEVAVQGALVTPVRLNHMSAPGLCLARGKG
jgi:hypothetical protein